MGSFEGEVLRVGSLRPCDVPRDQIQSALPFRGGDPHTGH